MWKHTKSPVLKRVINEKALFNVLTKYANPRYYSNSCRNKHGRSVEHHSLVDITGFFLRNKEHLLVNCKDHGPYSNCQQSYIFQVNTTSGLCQPFRRQPC